MSSNNITSEVDDLVEKVFKFVNSANCPTIEETIDCIRKAKAQIENSEVVIRELSHSNFNELNRIRDIFVKNYYSFKKAGVTQEWMYDLLNSLEVSEKILEKGKYTRFSEFSQELTPLHTSKLYGITPTRSIGGGEVLIKILLSSLDEVFEPNQIEGVSGDLMFRNEVFEVKGYEGRLDGAHIDDILQVIRNHEELNKGKQMTINSIKSKKLVQELLGCYFRGDNPYTIIAVEKNGAGYVIIDKTLEWDDDVEIKIRIPKWMCIKAFDQTKELKYNDNNRTIKIVLNR